MSKKITNFKTLLHLEACDCRWPIGDPRLPGFHFCGAQTSLGRPYCSEHWQLACEAPKPRVSSVRPIGPAIRRAA
jgi:hypothetical protein